VVYGVAEAVARVRTVLNRPHAYVCGNGDGGTETADIPDALRIFLRDCAAGFAEKQKDDADRLEASVRVVSEP
jgi:hypothetical protein